MVGSKTSVIDYILVCNELLLMIAIFSVLPYLEGDHLPLCADVFLPSKSAQISTSHLAQLELISKRVRWSENLGLKVREILNSESMGKQQNMLIDMQTNQDPLTAYEALIQKLKPILFMPEDNKPYNLHKFSKIWFDKECVCTKKVLSDIYFRLINCVDERKIVLQLVIISKKSV